jgi:hypothetical protein
MHNRQSLDISNPIIISPEELLDPKVRLVQKLIQVKLYPKNFYKYIVQDSIIMFMLKYNNSIYSMKYSNIYLKCIKFKISVV